MAQLVGGGGGYQSPWLIWKQTGSTDYQPVTVYPTVNKVNQSGWTPTGAPIQYYETPPPPPKAYKPGQVNPSVSNKTGTGSSSTGGGGSSLNTSGLVTGPTSTTSITGGGGGGATAAPAEPEINLNIPDLTWNPSAALMAEIIEQAKRRAALQIDPQVQSQEQALSRFNELINSQVAEANPRYTDMSLALANVIKNSVKQEAIDSAIRRNATGSGWLDDQMQAAGRFETEQRGEVERERNRVLNDLMSQQRAKQQEVSDALAELERLRGLQQAAEAYQLERQEREDWLFGKQSTFENELAQAELQNAVAARQAQTAYQNRLIDAQMQQAAWERAQAEKQYALDAAWQSYTMRPTQSYKEPDWTGTINVPGIGPVPINAAQAVSVYNNQYRSGSGSIFDTGGSQSTGYNPYYGANKQGITGSYFGV